VLVRLSDVITYGVLYVSGGEYAFSISLSRLFSLHSSEYHLLTYVRICDTVCTRKCRGRLYAAVL